MATPNIVMTRIDERLVHGQGQLWVKSLGVNTVIVANDQASQDAMAQTTPSGSDGSVLVDIKNYL